MKGGPSPVLHRHLAGRFNARLGRRLNTMLIGGAAEPLYLPASGSRPALIRYARDHAASVLHELAHWCLAGAAGRASVDYGLVYQPPPRSAAEQRRFYQSEVPVQALERLFCEACGVPFRCSDDNPGLEPGPDRRAFERQVTLAYQRLQRDGAGAEAELVLAALAPADRERHRGQDTPRRASA